MKNALIIIFTCLFITSGVGWFCAERHLFSLKSITVQQQQVIDSLLNLQPTLGIRYSPYSQWNKVETPGKYHMGIFVTDSGRMVWDKWLSCFHEYAWFNYSGQTAWYRRRFEQHEDFDNIVYCPYIWEADQMIQEKYGLYLVAFHTDEGWWGNISFMSDSSLWHKLDGHYVTREDLYNDYIKYCLENN